jgi:hypothetical protein
LILVASDLMVRLLERSMDMQRHLSFEMLDEKNDEYIGLTERNPAGRMERWSFYVALLAAGVGVLIGPLIGGKIGSWVTVAGLLVEFAGLILCLALKLKREWATFAKARRTYAKELEHDYRLYRGYVSWVRGFPDEEVARRLRYIRDRKGSMTYRLGLFTGGIERLGILPLIVALYLQFKDWEFGDWDALSSVNMLGGLLLWGLLIGYLASWWLIGLRTRMDSYEALLAEAVHEDIGAESK